MGNAEYKQQRYDPAAVQYAKAISLAPFGRGKRMCIGSNIAQVEARVILVRLLQDYKIVTDATEPPSMRQRTVVVPHPMPALKFEKI